MKSRFIAAAGVLAAAITTFDGTPVQAQWAPKDPPPQYVVNAGSNAIKSRTDYQTTCATAAELDCLESVEAFINGTWVKGIPTGRAGAGPDGAPRGIEFKVSGLVNEDGKDLVEVEHFLNYTGNVFHSVNMFASRFDGFKAPWESGRLDCVSKTDGKCMREGHLQTDIKYRVITRSSWVLPTHIGTKLSQHKVVVEKLAVSGATRVLVEGIPLYSMGIVDDSDITKEDGRGAWGNYIFGFSVSDGRFYPIKKDCVEKPTLVIVDNAGALSLPKFVDNQLDLRLSAPHFRPDGKTEHLGIYEAVIPLETATCLWGTSIKSASQFSVEVIGGFGGVVRTVITSVDVDKDNLRINASGFTFSSPTVRVKLATPTTTTTTSTTTTTTTAATTTTAVPTTATATAPARPTGVTTKVASRRLTVSFRATSGVTYSVRAAKGSATKRATCRKSGSMQICTTSSLAKGTWKVTVTPTRAGVAGTAWTKSVTVR